jgi:hypothetical protein
MQTATLDGGDLATRLSDIIRREDTISMDALSDQIFNMIEQFDTADNLYELSIALTNYYFGCFGAISQYYIAAGRTMAAEKTMLWCCKIVWKEEARRDYTFHKGTPYFFLGFCYLVYGNLDLAFQMIHNGYVEGLVVYRRLGGDYKTAPSYLFMTLNDNPNNALIEYVSQMKKKVQQFINDHNWSSVRPITFEKFDKKFLKRISGKFEQIKFFLTYFLMNLINLDKYDKQPLINNSFTILRKIDLLRGLSLIVDKTLSEKYNTEYISDGVIQYFIQKMGMPNDLDTTKLQNALTYSDGSNFMINGPTEDVVTELLANGVNYNRSPAPYAVKCMLLAWNLRNFLPII